MISARTSPWNIRPFCANSDDAQERFLDVRRQIGFSHAFHATITGKAKGKRQKGRRGAGLQERNTLLKACPSSSRTHHFFKGMTPAGADTVDIENSA